MPLPSGKSLADAVHDAVVAEVQKTSANSVELDVTLEGTEVSLNTTKKGWGITAYFKQLWKGGRAAGVRVQRPLGLLALIRQKDDDGAES
jgi:hypothetical protein